MTINPGDMRHRLSVLSLTERADGQGWEWSEMRRTWAAAEQTGRRSLFSSYGEGREEWKLTLRRQALSRHQAIRMGGAFLYLTEITQQPNERGWMTVRAAAIEPVDCAVERRAAALDPVYLRPRLTSTGEVHFPALLTEKYVRMTEGMPNDRTARGYILVTPKAVSLSAGELVCVRGDKWRVQIAHELEDYRNEYEILREEDL